MCEDGNYGSIHFHDSSSNVHFVISLVFCFSLILDFLEYRIVVRVCRDVSRKVTVNSNCG